MIERIEKLGGHPAIKFAMMALGRMAEEGQVSDTVPLHESYKAIVARGEADQIVGILVYEVLDFRQTAWVNLGWVVPSYRGEGLYRAMFEELTNIAKEAKLLHVEGGTLWTNKEMQEVMEKLGRKPHSITYRLDL